MQTINKFLGFPDTLLAWLDDRLERTARGPWRDLPSASLLLAPALLILGLFGFLPLGTAVLMSLYGGKQGMGAFVGLANYVSALKNPEFWHSALVTVYYVLGTIPVALVLSFFVAYVLSRIVRGRAFFRVVYFLPYITSAVAAAMVWRAMLNPQTGLVNAVIGLAGLPAQQWLLEPRSLLHLATGGLVPPNWGPSLALCCIMVFDIWHSSGFLIVVILAGLTAIPRELEEAARIDGAGTRQVLRHVILPLLTPTLFFLIVVSTIRAFQAFNSFYALTQGGARTLGTAENLILHLYANFYEYGYWGYGAAVAVLMSLAIIALTLVQWRFVGRRVHYT